MYSRLVTVLLLASAANGSGGAQVPITSYTCTQPNLPGFNDQGRCTVSGLLRTCEITEGSSPDSNIGGLYIWNGNTNPFVVLDIPQGWCVGSVKMTFRARGSIPALNLSVHSAKRLSTNTDRTVFSLVSEVGTTPVMMNLTKLARGKYLRINMTSTGRIYLQEIEVFGTNDSICTHPSSAGGDPASPTTSITAICAQVPTTSYTCTQPNLPGFNDQGRCTVSGGLRTCEITEGSGPDSNIGGLYIWNGNTNPFVVLDIPQGWCVESMKMTFRARGSIPDLSLSVHSAERLSTNTDRTMFSLVSEEGTTPVVMNLTTLARGKYLRINMTSTGRIYLQEIEVFGTNDSICTHPFSAGGDPASPTTSVGSSTYPVTPFRTSDYSATFGPTSTPSPSPSPTPGRVPVAPDSYVLPAAISAAAVLLVVVLTAVFGVVICIITHRHKTRKTLDVQRLSSIIYQSTQSDITFEDSQLHTGQSADVPIHDSVDANHNIEVRDAPCSYAVLGPSESNDSVFQGAAEEPMAEGAISRPTSQASIRSNEVSSKPIVGMVTWVHPWMLDHSYASNWENTTAGTDESGHYETSLHWQHAGGLYYNLSDCQLPGEDDRWRVLKDAKTRVGTTHQPPTEAPASGLPIAVDSPFVNTPVPPRKRRELNTSGPTYANRDPPSNSSTLAATQSPKQHSSSPKSSLSAKRPDVPQEDNIDKVSASSTSFPLPRVAHRSDGTREYTEVDAELWGGSGNVEGDTVAQPQSITSSTTAKGAIPTQEATMGHV